MRLNKKYLWIIPVIVGLAFLVRYRETVLGIFRSNSAPYYAVFLDNNQVYFGKIESRSAKEIVLNEVYYLAMNNNAGVPAQAQASFQLIKLGNEVHGPTDALFLNMAHVVFYEELRKDSAVVKYIEEGAK